MDSNSARVCWRPAVGTICGRVWQPLGLLWNLLSGGHIKDCRRFWRLVGVVSKFERLPVASQFERCSHSKWPLVIAAATPTVAAVVAGAVAANVAFIMHSPFEYHHSRWLALTFGFDLSSPVRRQRGFGLG